MGKKPQTNCRNCGGSGQEPNHLQIGSDLRGLRRKAELTLGDVSIKTGLSVSYLSDLERGFRRWTVALQETYRKALS